MGKYDDYQNLEGEEYSKFWGKGKWENYIVPLLPADCSGLTYIDMGCNAGQFLKLAEEKGFRKVIGVDCNEKAIEKGMKHRDKIGGKYELIHSFLEDALPQLPVADYMSFINSHYYILIQDWMRMMDYMHSKTRHVIITSVRKKGYYCAASAWSKDIKRYFSRNWEFVGKVPQLPREGDPKPRSLGSLCFRSLSLERVPLDKLTRGAHIQGDFHVQIDQGVPPLETRYFRLLCRRGGNKEIHRPILEKKMLDKVKMFESIKKYGVREPLIVNHWYRVLDGNHRKRILDYLGEKETIVRKV